MNTTLAICIFAMGGWLLPDLDDGTPALHEDWTKPTSAQYDELKAYGREMPPMVSPTLSTLGETGPSSASPPSRPSVPLGMSGLAPIKPLGPQESLSTMRGLSRVGTMPVPPMMAEGAGGNRMTRPGILPPGVSTAPAPVSGPAERDKPFGSMAQFQPALDAGTPGPNYNTQRYRSPYNSPLGPISSGKPFAGYQAPSPISPYQAMYNNPGNGTIAPYNAVVRPVLDQQRADQMRLDQERQFPSTNRGGPMGGGMQSVPGSPGLFSPQNILYYRQFAPSQGPQNMQPGMGP